MKTMRDGPVGSTDLIRAARCYSYGDPTTIVVEQLARAAPGPGEALVRVHAAAVNFPDVLIIANRYQVSADLPFTPGSEFAGTITAVGADVANDPDGLRPGDDVFGIL